MSNNRQIESVFNVQSIAPAGLELHQLKPFQLALFNEETQRTVDSPASCAERKFSLVWKSPSQGTQGAFKDQFNAKVPLKSLEMQNISKVSVFDSATAERKVFEAYLGFNGISPCRGLQFKCKTTYQLIVQVKGKPVRDVMGGRDFMEIIPFTTGCCEDCSVAVNQKAALDTAIKAFYNDSFQVHKFVDAYPMYSCDPVVTPFVKTAFQDYCITLCDNGDDRALAQVQLAYQSLNIYRSGRDGALSTYRVDCHSALPAAYVQTGTVLSNCDTCPSGYTSVAATHKYIISIANPALVGANPAQWLDEVNNVTALAATVSANLLHRLDGVSTYEVLLPAADALLSGVIAGVSYAYLYDVPVGCVQTTPVSTAWAQCGTAYKIKRKLEITLKHADCGGDGAATLAELEAAYTGWPDYVAGSLETRFEGDCLASFTLEQYSNCLEDGCDWQGADLAKFAEVPAFRGQSWLPVSCDGWTFDVEGVPVPPAATDPADCRIGIKFVGKNFENELVDCASDIWDSVETEGVTVEASISQYDLEACDQMPVDWLVAQWPTGPKGLGSTYERMEVHARQYDNYEYRGNRHGDGAMLQAKRGNSFTFDKDRLYHDITVYHNYQINRSTMGQGITTREKVILAVEANKTTLFTQVKSLINKITEATNGCSFV